MPKEKQIIVKGGPTTQLLGDDGAWFPKAQSEDLLGWDVCILRSMSGKTWTLNKQANH